MEDLLEHVRQRLKVGEPRAGRSEAEASPISTSASDEPYSSILESVLLLMRDAERCQDLMRPQQLRFLSHEQQTDLVALVRKVVHQVQDCEVALRDVVHHS
jgi:hypothetical protein